MEVEVEVVAAALEAKLKRHLPQVPLEQEDEEAPKSHGLQMKTHPQLSPAQSSFFIGPRHDSWLRPWPTGQVVLLVVVVLTSTSTFNLATTYCSYPENHEAKRKNASRSVLCIFGGGGGGGHPLPSPPALKT